MEDNVFNLVLPNGNSILLKCGENTLSIGAWDGTDDEWWICKIDTNGVLVYPNSTDGPEMLTRGLRLGQQIAATPADETEEQKEFLEKYIELWDNTPQQLQDDLVDIYRKWCKVNGLTNVLCAEEHLKALGG